MFEAGYEAAYLPTSYGRGLMPDTFIDYKTQRFRWAYGAMQILRHHGARCCSPTQQRADGRPALSLHRRLAALDRRWL